MSKIPRDLTQNPRKRRKQSELNHHRNHQRPTESKALKNISREERAKAKRAAKEAAAHRISEVKLRQQDDRGLLFYAYLNGQHLYLEQIQHNRKSKTATWVAYILDGDYKTIAQNKSGNPHHALFGLHINAEKFTLEYTRR